MSMGVRPYARRGRRRVDLLRAPVLGRFLRWRHARTTMQTLLLLLAVLVIYDGLTGPALASQNLAGVLPWVHWRGLVVLALLVIGNVFCAACPFMLPRRLAKRLLPANRPWPRWLANKWLAIGLVALFFWAYESFDPWASPQLTAWLVLAYFVAAAIVDGLFKGAAFCKYVCPIGQFNFVNSLMSPVEVAVRRPNTCAGCVTKDCIAGRRLPLAAAASRPLPVSQAWQAGCETWLFQPRKIGNMDCTFCLDCVQACPHDNVGLLARTPGAELWNETHRSSIGRLDQRPDLAALVLVLVFAAFLNALGMVRPVYALERWLAERLSTDSEPLVLLVLFGGGLIVVPILLAGLTASISRALVGERESIVTVASRFSYALAPLGLGMWLAHYQWHFFTGLLTVVPVVQAFLADHGLPLLGTPRWELGPVMPSAWLLPIEAVFLDAGLLGAVVVAYRIGRRHYQARERAVRAAAPWMLLAIGLFLFGIWLMLQPMEMRGTGLSA